VEVISDKNSYLPGEEVKLIVRTKDSSGTGVPAEVSLAVADLSVLALKGNPKKDPFSFFYDGFPLSVTTASNIKNVLYEMEIPLGTKGGGGGDPDDLAKKQRGTFKDTAYWNGTVETNSEGYGEVTFTLPDNLTTWQIESLGVTEKTELGVDYNEFTTKKDLMAIPLKPRFVVPGDEFSLGAQIFNQSDTQEEIQVTLQSDSLTFEDTHEARVTINPGESTSLFFPVTAPATVRSGTHAFTFTAKSSHGVDSVVGTIPITPNTVYETVATAHYTKDDVSTEYLYVPDAVVSDAGGLTINANATLAVFMSDALTYMARYPYGCSEQIASALSTIAMVRRALDVPGIEGSLEEITDGRGVTHTVESVVEDGLNRIYETQDGSGGISYYKGLEANLYLSIRIALALGELKDAGFIVREDVLERLIGYIEQESYVMYQTRTEVSNESIILGEYALREVGKKTQTKLTPVVTSIIDDAQVLNEKLNTMSLAYLVLLTAKDFDESDARKVYKVLTNRIAIDGRGAYLKGVGVSGYYETSILDTALLVRAFVAHEDEHTEMGNVLRWLLASRDRDGVWGSTQNTHAVVTALVEYLSWQHESEARFSLRGLLDGVELFFHRFTPENVFQTFTHVVPMADIRKGAMLPITFDEGGPRTNLYYDLALKYYLPAESVPPRDEGITITREHFALDDQEEKQGITTAKVGDVIKGKLTITVPDRYQDVSVEDIIPAGFELVNLNLATEDQTLLDEDAEDEYYDDWYGQAVPLEREGREEQGLFARIHERVLSWFGSSQTAQVGSWSYYESYSTTAGSVKKLRPTHTELHDDRVFLYIDSLSPGVYEYEYFIRALVPGTFQHLPASAQELYFPEIFGRTDGGIFTVTQDE
jgi:alpha-2-macroglobulin